MRLVRLQFKAFSQGTDITADIRQGWCAGVTSLVSNAGGSYSVESGQTRTDWIQQAYRQISALLDRINNHAVTVAAKSLQNLLGRVDMRSVENVCVNIHQDRFDGRECKVLLSATSWVPVVGYVSYVWQSEWVVNHAGYLVRAGNHMLIFDPNYGLGLFQITDNQPLTLKKLTDAIMGLAWASGYLTYYMSTTAAVAVVDEDGFGVRISANMEDQVRALSDMGRRFQTV
ncbi:MAG TPA: hypothetical protein VF883_22400 [Thermoanaerobaculia bacterium]|jgi:hypothetical protein